MKIGFLLHWFPTISETFVLHQITDLIDRGHDVEILAFAAERGAIQSDVERYSLWSRTHYLCEPRSHERLQRSISLVKQLLARRIRNPRSVARSLAQYPVRTQIRGLEVLLSQAREHRSYDIIAAHFGDTGLIACALRDIGVLDGRVVTTFHGYDMSRSVQERGEKLYSTLFRRGDMFLPVSEQWRTKLLEMGADPSRTHVHRMGVDTRNLSFREPCRSGGPLKLLSVARLVEKKGLDVTIDAIARLNDLDLEYEIIGEGPLRRHLETQVKRLGLEDRVRLRGSLVHEEVISAMRGADLLVAASRTAHDGNAEGIPVTLMEAMAVGLPVITTDHSGIPELVEKDVSGFVVPQGECIALAEAIHMASMNPKACARLARIAREKIVQFYNSERQTDLLLRRFRECLRSTSAAVH